MAGKPSMAQGNQDKDESRDRYDYIAHQINREDGLINYRLTWTLQLNGFLFAALALVGKDIVGPTKLFFEFALPITGLSVSLAGLLGVIAAHRQLKYLTEIWWDEMDGKEKYKKWPRPFGDSRAFSFGRMPSFVPVIILSVVWFELLVHNIVLLIP